jgi:hypothetical protein
MNGYVTSKRLLQLRDSLTDSDWQIILTLSRIRVATAAQVVALHLPDLGRRRALRRLSALVRNRVLARLPRSVGGPGGGSTGHIYALDTAGQRLVDLTSGGRPSRPWALGAAFLNHSLAVSDVYVRLAIAGGAGTLRLVRFDGEPHSWRPFHGPGGERVTLKPDAYAVVQIDGFEDSWFLEVDLGTEHLPALGRKLAAYRRYWQSGTEQANHDVFPLVLWLVPDERRAQLLAGAIARQPVEARSLFVVSLHAEAVQRMGRGAES